MNRRVIGALCLLGPAPLLFAQTASQPSGIEPRRPTGLLRSYQAPEIPPIRLADSSRLQNLIRAGVLYLTIRDAIVLALENNLDLEIARYGPILADWNLERSQAGGALPGVTNGASLTGAVASGQGVQGSQAAAGVTAGGPSTGGGGTNATVSQVGPIAQTLDPSFQEATSFSHISQPQFNSTQSGIPLLILNTHVSQGSYQQGFLFGGNLTASYSDHYLKENAATDILNPSVATTVSLSFRQNLLRGLGAAVNGRQIEVSRINRSVSGLNFRNQVSSTVANVLNQYYELASDYADRRAKRQAVEVSQQLYQDAVRRQQLGAISPLDVTVAQSQLASAQSDLVVSETNLQRQQIQFKALLGRRGALDSTLDTVQVLPLSQVEVPAQDDLPPLPDLIREALANSDQIAIDAANLKAAQTSAIGTLNGTRPTLQVFGSMNQAGLAGASSGRVDPYFVGGIGTALGQVFRRNFPSQSVVPVFVAPIHNREALADNAIDQLQMRQTELIDQKDANQVQVAVQNYVIGLRQARARYQAAVRNRQLQEQLFAGEREKLALGASTPADVVQLQRDLVSAQAAEIAAEASYSTARIALDQVLGRTLAVNHVSIDEARKGLVAQPSSLPPQLPPLP